MDRHELHAKVRREQRLRRRVRRATWRLRQAEAEDEWAIASARAAGLSVRAVAEEAGRSPSRIQQITSSAAAPDRLLAALAELRLAGWPAPEDPDGSEDEELAGRDHVAQRLADEVGWLLACAAWVDQLDQSQFPPVVNLRPDGDDDDYRLIIRLSRVAAVLRRIAYDVDELARARTVEELGQAGVAEDVRAERRRRLAEPDLTYAEFHRMVRQGHHRRGGQSYLHPYPRTDADIWRDYQLELRDRGEPHTDPWGFNPYEFQR